MTPPQSDDRRASAEAHRQAAKRFLAAGQFQEAVDTYDAYLTFNPNDAAAIGNQANALRELGRTAEALANYAKAIALTSADPAQRGSLHYNRGNALFSLQRYEEALADYTHTTSALPDFAEAHVKRGLALQALQRSEPALAAFNDALRLAADVADTHYARASVLYDLARFDECVASYDAAVALRPDMAGAHRDRGFCLLSMGDFARGWRGAEWRKRVKNPVQVPAAVGGRGKPEWTGAAEIAGKTVLIYAEQGFGDTIQFARYARDLERRGAKVILAVQRALRDFLGKSLSPAISVIADSDEPPEFDFSIALLSLPLALGIDTMDALEGAPYLALPPDSSAPLRGAGVKVGLVWRGNPNHNKDRRRSLALADLEPLTDVPGVDWFSLQVGAGQNEPFAGRWAGRITLLPLDAADFTMTAVAMNKLDLVISVDTAPAHLAGALGKPVWVLVSQGPDWRWFHDRDDSPWYASMRLFRQQPPWNWAPTIARLAQALQDRAGASGKPTAGRDGYAPAPGPGGDA